jgi:type IV pilus assembly protein PilN
MIRINLLGGERQKPRRTATFDVNRRIALASVLILVLSGLGIGWWYWSLTEASQQVDAEIAAAQQESSRLTSLLAEVRQFEQRRAQLDQRVALIEQLRKGQSIPVQLLDLVSRSLPDMLWLTQMSQQGADVTIEGRSTTLIALSDFVGNLGSNDFFKKPVEILDSQVESGTAPGAQGAGNEIIKFTVKAQLAHAPMASAPPGRK